MLLWASKFATAKIECIASKWEVNIFRGSIYFAGDDTIISKKNVFQ